MGVMSFFDRFEALQLHRDTSDQLIKDLLLYVNHVETTLQQENDKLQKDLQDAQLDLDDARRTRRELQLQISNYTSKLDRYAAETENLKSRNPYIMVLIDGDGMIFNEELIAQGIEGGKRTANMLRNTILESYNDLYGELPDDIEIICKIYANIAGLGRAMVRDGCIQNSEDLKNFALGFTQAKASFDFADVGHGKERADSKIKELTRWNLKNHNCRQILLGISHDAGYAPFLDDVLNNDSTSRRVTLIEGPPLVHELTSSNLAVVNYHTIFRSEKLISKITNSPPLNNNTPIASSASYAGVTSVATPPVTPAPAPFPPPPKSMSIPITHNTATTKTAPPKPVWSPGPRGLDPPAEFTPQNLEKIKNRPNKKLCNNHYLRGSKGCNKGDDCKYEHKYKPTEGDLNVIRYLTRLNPCSNRQECDLETCIYGHHCPNIKYAGPVGGWVCEQWGCRFDPEDHPPGCNIKHPQEKVYYT